MQKIDYQGFFYIKQMKYICGYKTYVKYGRVCFNTLIGCE